MKLLLTSFLIIPLFLFGQTSQTEEDFKSAASLEEKGKFKKALKIYSKIISKNPSNGVAYFKRAALKNKVGQDFCTDLKTACKLESVEQKSACENHEMYCEESN
ncbi:MAG: hypothetical protein P8I93_06270 [Crocinitomicaceae bacterium]|nr:hypothetical protein [Crocinitomicaceae bacterium]